MGTDRAKALYSVDKCFLSWLWQRTRYVLYSIYTSWEKVGNTSSVYVCREPTNPNLDLDLSTPQG